MEDCDVFSISLTFDASHITASGCDVLRKLLSNFLRNREGREEVESEENAGGSKANVCSLRKEVIQPHLPVRLPCYDLAPITSLTFGASLPFASSRVRTATSGTTDFRGLTGGVYKTRERIHRDLLIRDY